MYTGSATSNVQFFFSTLAQADAPVVSAPVQAVGVPSGATAPIMAPSGVGTPTASSESAPIIGGNGAPMNVAPAASGGLGPIIWLLPVMLIVMILVSTTSGRKEKKRRAALLGSIKRNDKVQTLGGIIGTVIEMNDDEVVIRIEEGKIRVSKSSVQTILREAKSPAASTASV